MTITLKSVELSNIRSHKHFLFKPAENGLTSISGANGSGKSTIVDSIAWVLFGTKPQGVSKVIAILKDGVTIGKEKCYARVELDVSGRQIKIERRMVTKAGAVECEVFEKLQKDDGNEPEWETTAGPSVSHAEPYIRKLLGMDEKGFLAAILVQQKQVDQLISATPRERAAVIEKLTGIASVTAAVSESRQEFNSLKKMSAMSTIDDKELENLKVLEGNIRSNLAALSKSFNSDATLEKEIKQKGAKLKEELNVENEKFSKNEAAKTELTQIEANIKAMEVDLDRLVSEKNAKKSRLGNYSQNRDTDDLKNQLSEISEKVEKLREASFSQHSHIKEKNEELEKFNEIVSTSKVKEIQQARGALKKQEEKLEALISRNSLLVSEVGGFEARRDSLFKAIEIIKEEDGHCPTCLQKVDEIELVTSSLDGEAEELNNKIQQNLTFKEKIDLETTKTETMVEKITKLCNALENVPVVTNEIKKLKVSTQTIDGELKTLEAELKTLEKTKNNADAVVALNNEYEELLKLTKLRSDEIESLKKRRAELLKVNISSKTITELNKLRNEYDNVRNEYTEISQRHIAMHGEINLEKERLKNTCDRIADQEERIAKHKELLQSVEIAGNSTQLLEEFRTNRIENSVPIIEAYSSELLNRFTEGKFTRLRMDSKFNASVVLADGKQRAIGLLSGGELSAASMALRLAISMLLNGSGSHSLIILDEVLVSQDAARAELILSTVKDVCKGQVVLIAHNDSINDVSDKLIELS